MKILLDMNLSPPWLGFLEQGGHECLHWSDVGSPKATDREIMHFETTLAQGALVTVDESRARARILPLTFP
jgi:predicted nuclease of predicted toxin-antitoxin system